MNAANLVHVSAASIWELAVKASSRRIRLREPTSDTLLTLASRHGFLDLPVTTAHAAAVLDVPPAITDPFDRLIVAQARVENLRLLTADAILLDNLPGLFHAGS
jgi:PIN domain nuclease of toxin-antitoxin system